MESSGLLEAKCIVGSVDSGVVLVFRVSRVVASMNVWRRLVDDVSRVANMNVWRRLADNISKGDDWRSYNVAPETRRGREWE